MPEGGQVPATISPPFDSSKTCVFYYGFRRLGNGWVKNPSTCFSCYVVSFVYPLPTSSYSSSPSSSVSSDNCSSLTFYVSHQHKTKQELQQSIHNQHTSILSLPLPLPLLLLHTLSSQNETFLLEEKWPFSGSHWLPAQRTSPTSERQSSTTTMVPRGLATVPVAPD